MRVDRMRLFTSTLGLVLLLASSVIQARQCVVLLHGLARTSASMARAAEFFAAEDYTVANIGYPSRHHSVEQLAEMAVPAGLAECQARSATPVNFVTHSMGGILLRQYLQRHELPQLGRVVMLAPPNQGSEVVDRLGSYYLFQLLNGPAGSQLGTGAEDVPARLGPVDFELGVIAGTRSINPILSTFLPNPDDGKVSLARTRVAGMRDFLALKTTHPLMMRNSEVLEQSLYFIENGQFNRQPAP
ncbi:MAG: alpha/beta fold hydrolase [Gammaproteobacteria bacterium]|nr:alpha/beta fold hydrolase [Gammaproteobacteria bacterium]